MRRCLAIDIGITLDICIHPEAEDAAEELHRMEEAENARREQGKLAGKEQKMLRVVILLFLG